MYVSEMKIEIYSGTAGGVEESLEMVNGLPTWRVLDFTKTPQNWDGGVISVGKTWKNDGSGKAQPADGTVYMEVKPGKTLTFENNHAAYPGEDYWKAGFTASTGNAFVAPEIPKQ